MIVEQSSARPGKSYPRSPALAMVAMTSLKKVAANRVNGRKSRGPSAGKTRSSRNARRHGLAAFNTKDRALSGQIKQLVDAICNGDDDPLLREPAVAIAENASPCQLISSSAWPPAFLKANEQRDEYQVLHEGMRDLERLLRYEKRAWSRRNKAVRAFMAIKLTQS